MLKPLVRTLRDIAESFSVQFGPRRGRSLQATGAACAASALVGVGKLLMGLASMSFFTCVSALYTFCMVIAKVVALAGLARESDRAGQMRYCRLAGMVLALASALYMLYSLRLLWQPRERGYHLYVALGIATFTFAELGLNIRGVLVERRHSSPLFHTIKTVNLASAMIGLVLTQRVLLALDLDGAELAVRTRANVFMGVLMGFFATGLGVGLILRMGRSQGSRCGSARRSIVRRKRHDSHSRRGR